MSQIIMMYQDPKLQQAVPSDPFGPEGIEVTQRFDPLVACWVTKDPGNSTENIPDFFTVEALHAHGNIVTHMWKGERHTESLAKATEAFKHLCVSINFTELYTRSRDPQLERSALS